jgi:hypothetical protein
VGSYNILTGTAGGTAIGNYTPTVNVNAHVLNITQVGVTGSLTSNPSKTYGASDPAPASLPITLSGQVNANVTDWNGTLTAIDDTSAAALTGTLTSLTRIAGENVGGYNYTAGTLTLSGTAVVNYSGAAFVPGGSLLNITPAPLTVTADDKSRPIGVPNPPFTASYAGFQFGETPAVLGGVLVFATPATIVSPPGLYSITPSGQTSTNYTITYVNGVLTVGGLPPFVTGGNLLISQFAALQRTIAAGALECSRDPTAAPTPSAAMRALAASSGPSLSACGGGGAGGDEQMTEITPPVK